MNEPKIEIIGMLDVPGLECIRRVYNTEGIAPTLSTMQGGGRQPMVMIPYNTEPDGTSRIIKAQYAKTSAANFERNGSFGATGVIEMSENYHIRKLTPKECWRLMGFDDSDFEKAEAVCSNTQLYKQAGNSIVVPVIEAIYKQLGW